MKDGTDDIRVYTFDMKEQLLVGNEPIATADSKENTRTDIRLLNEFIQHHSTTKVLCDS